MRRCARGRTSRALQPSSFLFSQPADNLIQRAQDGWNALLKRKWAGFTNEYLVARMYADVRSLIVLDKNRFQVDVEHLRLTSFHDAWPDNVNGARSSTVGYPAHT